MQISVEMKLEPQTTHKRAAYVRPVLLLKASHPKSTPSSKLVPPTLSDPFAAQKSSS
jgi:hypothetical protein